MRRILFVDDEPRILEGLQRMSRSLRREWETAFAPGGEAALALLEAHPFDVIVSTMRMPGMDGAALLGRVREQFPEVVRIVLSGHTELDTALRAVPVAHQFLAKPCDAETLRVAVERACHLKALLSDDSIRRTVGALGDLPALPRIYEALMRTLADPDVSLHKVGCIVEQDVGISAKILQLVNSAFFGVMHSITNIQSAVSFLGISTLSSLVLSVEIFRAFEPEHPIPGFSLDKLQQHARLTAQVAVRLPAPKHLAEVCLAAGMFHDVGKLIMAWKLRQQFEGTLKEAAEEQCPLYRVEEREYGFGHAEIGAYLLGLWGLPYAVVEAVALHHAPNRVPHQNFDAVSAVYVANLLAHELESASEEGSPTFGWENYQADLAELGVQERLPEWQAIVKDMPRLPGER